MRPRRRRGGATFRAGCPRRDRDRTGTGHRRAWSPARGRAPSIRHPGDPSAVHLRATVSWSSESLPNSAFVTSVPRSWDQRGSLGLALEDVEHCGAVDGFVFDEFGGEAVECVAPLAQDADGTLLGVAQQPRDLTVHDALGLLGEAAPEQVAALAGQVFLFAGWISDRAELGG